MLVKKVSGQPFATEWPTPSYSQVEPAPPLQDIAHAKIALVTTGGVVPRGNPDRLESAYASKWLKYPIGELNDLKAQRLAVDSRRLRHDQRERRPEPDGAAGRAA